MPLAVRIEVMTEKCKQLDQKVAVVGRQIKEREIQYVGAPQSNSWDSLMPVFSVYIAKIKEVASLLQNFWRRVYIS